jgi:hypothetical protein
VMSPCALSLLLLNEEFGYMHYNCQCGTLVLLLGVFGCVVCLLPRLVSLLSNVVAIMIHILARQMWLMLGLVMVG